jgi:hypothetical protein
MARSGSPAISPRKQLWYQPRAELRLRASAWSAQRHHGTDVLAENGEDHCCAGNYVRIVARGLQCASRKIGGMVPGGHRIFRPAVIDELHIAGRRDEGKRRPIVPIEETSNVPVPYRDLAACCAHMGRLDEARDVVTRLRAITPNVIPPRMMYLRDAEHPELYLSGLRLAAGTAA